MTVQPRYVTSRGKFGSPLVLDCNRGKRPVLVCLRDPEADGKDADEAAVIMAQLCAIALNRTDAQRRQQEGSK